MADYFYNFVPINLTYKVSVESLDVTFVPEDTISLDVRNNRFQ